MPTKGTSADKVARDAAIVTDRASGMAWAKIAKKHGVSERHAHRIWDDEKEARIPALQERDAIDVIYESLRRYEQWQNELADLSEKSHGAIKVGAVRAQMDCEARKIELMQVTGLLPKQLGKLAIEWDVRWVIRQVVEVLDRHDAPPELQRAMLAAIKREN